MLQLEIKEIELYDEVLGRFVPIKGCTLQLEHSLISLSKWESKWKKPFLQDTDPSPEEFIDYIRCMTLNKNVPELTYVALTKADVEAVKAYINDSYTATTINDHRKKRMTRREVVTSEVIYYWLTVFNLPFDVVEKWHLNRLLTLIDVCSIKGNPSEKMSRDETRDMYRRINAARRKKG